jgi:hypothetical protein
MNFRKRVFDAGNRARIILVLIAAIFVFFAGFRVGSADFSEKNEKAKEIALKQMMEAKSETPEQTEAILALKRLGAKESAQSARLNFWMALLPSILIAIDISIHLLEKRKGGNKGGGRLTLMNLDGFTA